MYLFIYLFIGRHATSVIFHRAMQNYNLNPFLEQRSDQRQEPGWQEYKQMCHSHSQKYQVGP